MEKTNFFPKFFRDIEAVRATNFSETELFMYRIEPYYTGSGRYAIKKI